MTTTRRRAPSRGCGSSRSSGASRCSASSSSTSSARSSSRSCSRSWSRTSSRRWWRAPARCASAARPFPRWAAVIILYVNILAGWGCSSATSSPSCRATSPGCSGRRPRCSPRSTRTGCRGRAPGSTRTSRPRRSTRATSLTSHAEEPQAPRAIVVEPLPDGRYRIDLEAVTFEVKPTENGRYLIAPPAQDGSTAGGRQVGALDQAVARDPAEVDRGGEPARARVRAEVHRRRGVRHRAAVPGVDGGGVHPDRSRPHPGLPALAGARTLSGRLRPHLRRHRPRAVGRDPRPAAHLPDQRRPDLRRSAGSSRSSTRCCSRASPRR